MPGTGTMMRMGLLAVLLCLPLPVAAESARSGWSPDRPAATVRAPGGPARAGAHHSEPARSRKADEAATPVNVNTATAAGLVALKGVGDKKARAILAFRKAHGPFSSLDDFEEVPGIGPALIEANRDRIRFR